MGSGVLDFASATSGLGWSASASSFLLRSLDSSSLPSLSASLLRRGCDVVNDRDRGKEDKEGEKVAWEADGQLSTTEMDWNLDSGLGLAILKEAIG